MFGSYVNWGTKRNAYFKKKKYEINYYNYSKEIEYTDDEKNIEPNDKYRKLNMQKKSSIKVNNYKRDYASQSFRSSNGIDKYLRGSDFDSDGNRKVKYELDMD